MFILKKMALLALFLMSFSFSFPVNAETLKDKAPIILGYWENWGTYHGFPMPGSTEANELMRGQLTGLNAVAYAFLEIAKDGSLQFTDVWADLSSKNDNDNQFCAKSPQSCPNYTSTGGGIGSFDAFLKSPIEHHIISVGGAGHDDAFENAFKNPDQFILSLKLLLTHFKGINGLDLDYEPVGGIPESNVEKFISLIQRIKTEIPALNLSYTLIANHNDIQRLGKTVWEKLSASLDYVGVMGYDLHGAFDSANPITALHSTLYSQNNDFSTDKAIQTLITMGVPKSKLLLGIPMYGRAVGGVNKAGLGELFSQSFQGDLDDKKCVTNLHVWNMCPGVISYKGLLKKHYKEIPVLVNDKLAGVYSYDPENKLFISYDSTDSAAEKARYAKDHGLAGVFFWSLRSDVKITHPKSLLVAVAHVFGINPYQPERLSKPLIYSYWAGWKNAAIPDFKLDGLLLAFAIMKKGDSFYTDYTDSASFQDAKLEGSSFKTWNNWLHKFHDKGARAYVSYGGGSNEELRGYIINASDKDLSTIANEIQANVGRYFFDGVDLDIESWWNFNTADNKKFANNLAIMVNKLRLALDSDPATRQKPIMLTVGWNAAGPAEGMPDGSSYTGTMIPFFADEEAMKAISAVNIMSYNVEIPDFYAKHDLIGKILNAFTEAGVPEEKLMLGVQPYQNPYMAVPYPATPLETIKSLGEYIKKNNYGGLFMWGIGSGGLGVDTKLPVLSAYDYLKAMKTGLGLNEP